MQLEEGPPLPFRIFPSGLGIRGDPSQDLCSQGNVSPCGPHALRATHGLLTLTLHAAERDSKLDVSCSVMSDSFETHGSSVHGISQARILEWVVISFSRGLS